MNRNHLSIEIKSKIIAMREYSTSTWPEIAAECGCSVSKKKCKLYFVQYGEFCVICLCFLRSEYRKIRVQLKL